ncbi:hypothetical protein B0T21DRAFT_412445 [Apiosordaria backusii]|uniref:Uncharacterized protein n=1 Tax=Apiosordaria backusii TaxID=314023 RepID=A0AA40BKH2_9PEZI|nr:hypothetical protein B0T21DRAFT_412445 [Apiosordaria backusii]
MAPKKFIIPRAFNWLLPAQGVVAAVAIYASIYVFGVGTIPMILAVVAAGIHFLLGLYFCLTQSLPGTYHNILIPIFLLLGTAVWSACLYYFAKFVDHLLTYPSLTSSWSTTSQPQTPTWSKVGLATSVLNIFLDLALLLIFLLSILDQRPPKPSVLPTTTTTTTTTTYTSHHQFTPLSVSPPQPNPDPHHTTTIPPVPPIPSIYTPVPPSSPKTTA